MSSKKHFKNRAPMSVTQDHLDNQPRHIVVNTDKEFLLFLESGKAGYGHRTPILLELTEDRQVKMTVSYDKNRTFPLLELETPAAILGLFDLKDDPDDRFAKLCEVALAIWKVAPPTFDLLISSAKLGIGSTDHADDKILWWKIAGEPKQEPPRPYAITNPVIQHHLLAYELVDTEVKEFEVIRKYHKLDDLAIARQAGATHKDRHGCFFKKGESGILEGEIQNGSIDWQLSLHYHMPDTTEVL